MVRFLGAGARLYLVMETRFWSWQMPKCGECGIEMKPLFSSFYCPDEDKPDHGKVDIVKAGNQFLGGTMTLKEFQDMWRKYAIGLPPLTN